MCMNFWELQLLKSAYWNGYMMAANQAREHLKLIWDDTDEIEVSKGKMELWQSSTHVATKSCSYEPVTFLIEFDKKFVFSSSSK